MAGHVKKGKDNSQAAARIAENKKARFDYAIEETLEAGAAGLSFRISRPTTIDLDTGVLIVETYLQIVTHS